MSSPVIADLVSALPAGTVSTDPATLDRYATDWTGLTAGQAAALVRPGTSRRCRRPCGSPPGTGPRWWSAAPGPG